MSTPDFNLLIALDVLLAEGSVARAARRLQLSASAMSRTLARLRETTGDPLLVRAGRGLVPTPRALELRERVAQLVQDAEAVLRPAEQIDLSQLQRTFTLRSRDGFVENFGAALIARLEQDAPQVRLRFMAKLDKDSSLLRDGTVDLEIGVVGSSASPEVRSRILLRDRFVGVVRAGHALSHGAITPERYASARHVLVARRAQGVTTMDESLKALGLEREVTTIVGEFPAAMALARASDLVATVPERHVSAQQHGLFSFALPFDTPPLVVSMLWHPRMDADAAHRWLRECVREVCSS
ncbi:DNA-binding transcriptional LysR family regulator [Pseudomonas sp. JUb42]|uniref:LysR family transcriptional regulator n=1 Tax=Pseudomonas sp. JUb42 TaxID=2940611 RepID=UPI0021682813|nr:LysR family transcriptional regulator [Pseudomonas sp. JUb42]MCS3467881.1 DNA-binding transcriptional LysR family regulator [Pseudomonas sp. JUb42]